MLLFAFGTYFNGKVDMGSRHFNNIVLFYTNGLSGAILVLYMANVAKGLFAKVLTILGQSSLTIMVFHVLYFQFLNGYGVTLRYWPLFALFGLCMPLTINKPFKKVLTEIVEIIDIRNSKGRNLCEKSETSAQI